MSTPAPLNNRYQIIEPLGTGGMAQVYRARDLMLERFVAIKVLRSDYSSDPDFQIRFRQEAKAAANLSHPNIVTVHDFGYDQGQLFIVMEHVPGTNLKTMIENLGKFSLEDAIPLMVQACAGLGYAHRAGLVHCDVKPHNMLVTPDRRLKVTDFGIARAIAGIHPEEQHDVVWGSPLYFAPEQAAGQAPRPLQMSTRSAWSCMNCSPGVRPSWPKPPRPWPACIARCCPSRPVSSTRPSHPSWNKSS